MLECRNADLPFRIVSAERRERPDAPHALQLLRMRGERPHDRRTAEQADELAASDHSITSSARASNVGEISIPSALAVLRLMTSWNVVGCCIGKSAGFSPFRIRPM